MTDLDSLIARLRKHAKDWRVASNTPDEDIYTAETTMARDCALAADVLEVIELGRKELTQRVELAKRTFATLTKHFEAFEIALASPLTDEEREAMYAQAHLSADICREVLGADVPSGPRVFPCPYA